MGPRVFHAKFQPDRPKGVGLTTSGAQQLLGEQLIWDKGEVLFRQIVMQLKSIENSRNLFAHFFIVIGIHRRSVA